MRLHAAADLCITGIGDHATIAGTHTGDPWALEPANRKRNSVRDAIAATTDPAMVNSNLVAGIGKYRFVGNKVLFEPGAIANQLIDFRVQLPTFLRKVF